MSADEYCTALCPKCRHICVCVILYNKHNNHEHHHSTHKWISHWIKGHDKLGEESFQVQFHKPGERDEI